MDNLPLLRRTAEELLDEFGMGNPTPGSGSAAALQVLVSVQLLKTVILLTGKEKFKPLYDPWLPELNKIKSEIETQIYPELKNLFQEDSNQFAKYILLYKEHEREQDVLVKGKKNRTMLKQLVVVTECALALTRICAKVGTYAEYVFVNGFKDARGDSAMALNGAIASLGGCLAIIELNLLSFEWNDWTSEVRLQLDELKTTNKNLLGSATNCLKSLEQENSQRHNSLFEKMVEELRSGRWEDAGLSEKGVEELARHMQNILWQYRDLIWKDETIGNYLDVLKPRIAIEKLLGYRFGYADLGRHQTEYGEAETAGQIHKNQQTILVSKSFPRQVQNFTSAHELGHALLHKETGLHRDISLDGSPLNTRDLREVQANKFATFFLMPAKHVKAQFEERFLMEKFIIDDNTVFFLNESRVSDFKRKVRNRDELARHLASTDFFRRPFSSMAETFNVSPSAMGYRLIELGLVDY